MQSAYPVPFTHAAVVIDAEQIIGAQGSLDKEFPLASVTKLVTALATLVAVQDGHLALDDPAGPPGATLLHLLAHASGLALEGDGTRVAAPVESRRIYSNQGYNLIGQIVSDAVGMPFAQWVDEKVAQPLRMRRFTLEGAPASGGRATSRDLAALAREMMNSTLLSPELAATLRTTQFPGLRGIVPGYGPQTDNVWGVGAELRGQKNPHWLSSRFPAETYGHFGVSGSFLWVDPTLGTAGIFLGSEPFGEWHRKNWPALTDQMRTLPAPR